MKKDRANVSSALLLGGGILVILSIQLTQDLPVYERIKAVLFSVAGVFIFLLRMHPISHHYSGYTNTMNDPEV